MYKINTNLTEDEVQILEDVFQKAETFYRQNNIKILTGKLKTPKNMTSEEFVEFYNQYINTIKNLFEKLDIKKENENTL